MSATAPWEWKQLMAEALQEAKIIPLWGNPPPFPWEDLSDALAQKWNLQDLKISCLKTSWGKKEQALQGLGTRSVLIPIDVAPLSEVCFWAISSEDMHTLSQAVLQPPAFKDLPEDSISRGCFQFLLLQTLQAFSENQTYPSLRAILAEDCSLVDDTLFIAEIRVRWSTGNIYGKIILPRTLIASFREFYRVDSVEYMHSPAAHELSVPLSLVAGRSTLALSQWKLAQVGDFLKLDMCTLSPTELSGHARLMLNDTALFTIAIKKEKVSVSDFAFYQEDTMQNFTNDDEDEEKDEHEMLDNEEIEEDQEEETFEEDLSDEDFSELQSDQDKEEETEESPDTEKLEHTLAQAEIPITLVVEIGRIQMNLDKVLELQPGNVLDLAQNIDTHVRICSNGKCLATGELVALGETLGVKITKIGS